jgi:hypothetical protein
MGTNRDIVEQARRVADATRILYQTLRTPGTIRDTAPKPRVSCRRRLTGSTP